MEKDNFILLLQIIAKNGNLESLHRQGFQYSQIAGYIQYVLEEGYVEHTKNGFNLTSEGKGVLLSYNKQLQRKNSEALISPQKEYLLETVQSKFDVYLPSSVRILD